jgi:protein Tex
MKPINLRVAEELGVRAQQVAAAISLLDGGATVPFVARYRKEATGALDDAQLRTLAERLTYLRELEERRAAIIDSISQQGKLDPALKQAIDTADGTVNLSGRCNRRQTTGKFNRKFIGNPCCRSRPRPEMSGFWKLCARQQ